MNRMYGRQQYRHLTTQNGDKNIDARMTELGMQGWYLCRVVPYPTGGLWLFFERLVPDGVNPPPPAPSSDAEVEC
jgi:hypothetical protein